MSQQAAVAARLPDWLRAENAIAYWPPEKILFVPQRVIRRTPKGACLVDYAEREYLLRECQMPRLEHLNAIAQFIPESGETVSVYRMYAQAGTYAVSDGRKSVWMQVESDEVARAARSLAQAFNGVVVTEEDLTV